MDHLTRVILHVNLDPTELLGTPAYIVIVGASCVNSIELEDRVKKGVKLMKGNALGYFAFGGSTVLT